MKGVYLIAAAVGSLLVLGVTEFARAGDGGRVGFFTAGGEPVGIAIAGFVGMAGVSQEQADVIADILADEISQLGRVKIITKTDLISVLTLEKQKRLSGCADVECFGEVSSALGVPWMVTGNISRFGSSYVLNLKLMDTKNVFVAGRVSRKIKGDEDDLLDELPRAVRELFDRVTERLGLQVPDRVTVAAKHSQPITESPSSVTVITREQIENTYCTDVVCLLRQLPEVDVLRIKPAYATVGARALTDEGGERALLLIDGRELNNEVFGMPYWQALPVHLADIERIEVIRGPGSALYGANAHSMVVSIHTRQDIENTAETFLGSGQHDRSSLHLRLGQSLGSFRLQLLGGLETAGHWQMPALREREIGRVRFRVDHQDGSADTSIRGGLLAAEGVIYSVFGPAEMTNMLIGDVGASYRREHFRTQLSFSATKSTLFVEVNEVSFEGVKLGEICKEIPFLSTDLDLQAQVEWSLFESNLLIAGGGFRWLTAMSDKVEPSGAHQIRLGLFVHDEQRLGDSMLLTAGIRFDYNSITPFTVSPRFAGIWEFGEDQFLRLAVSQAFRKPAFFHTSIHLASVTPEPAFPELTDLFLKSVGNEDLDNESITTLEAGYRGRFLDERLSVEVVAFFNRYRDTLNLHIDIAETALGTPDLENSVVEYLNSGREVDSLGGSLSITYRVQARLYANFNYTYRYSWYIAEPGGTAAVGEGGKGDRVEWEPVHLANLSCTWLPGGGLRLGLGWHGASAKTGYTLSSGSTFDRRMLVPLPARWFLSVFLAWRVDFGTRWAELGIRAFNLLNRPYRELPPIPDDAFDYVDRLSAEQIGRRIFFFFRGSV